MTTLLYALPLALVWMMIVGRATLEMFIIGYVAGVVQLIWLHPHRIQISWQRLPVQIVALAIYLLLLFRDIFLAGIDLARRVLSPNMRLKSGIITIDTQDPEHNHIIAALSAIYISLPPGELVVGVKDDHILYVHCLDVEAAEGTLARDQTRRLNLLRRLMGRD